MIAWRNPWLRHVGLPLALLAAAVALQQSGSLDQRIADGFFERETSRWVGAHTWWAETLIHELGRWVVWGIGIAALALAAAGSTWRPLAPPRRAALYVACCMALGPALVAAGKALTDIGCPRQLTRYGGERPFVGLLDERPAQAPRGECFPGGHSSGAFALVALGFACRPAARARALLAGAIALGGVFSLGQWTRGAHFPSHDLASAAICWGVAGLLFLGPFGSRLWAPR